QSNVIRRRAERILLSITALNPDLMRPVSLREAHEIVLCQLETPACVRIGHHFSAWYAHGIELVVPRRVERVGPVDPLAVTANLDHLRTAAIHLAAWVRGTTSDAADVDRACKLWLPRVRDVLLTHLAGSPTSDIEEPVIHGKVAITDQRPHCAKRL